MTLTPLSWTPLSLAAVWMLPAAVLGAGGTMGMNDSYPHPVLNPDTRWVGVMLIIIAALFVAAAVIGPIVCANMSRPMPPTHSYDEPPGASQHHGHGGAHRNP